jgi:predicted MFS family arabinose efflux permease
MPGTYPRITVALAVAAIGVLPPFLIGASAIQVSDSLAIGHAQIGIAAAAAFATAGVVSRAAGRWVQRTGGGRALVLAALLSAASLTVIATSPSFPVLVTGLCLSGLGNAVAQPAANLLISRLVSLRRLGVAIGVKQSSIPLATLACGVVVPIVVFPLGWRATFAIFAVVTVGIASAAMVLSVSDRTVPVRLGTPAGEHSSNSRRSLALLAVAACIGSSASGAMGVFFVGAGVDSGLSGSQASILLSGCSVMGLGIRIALGWAADAFPRLNSFAVMAALLAVGSIGYLLLAQGVALAFVAGGIVAYGAGWTWAGLAHLTAIRESVDGAAAATGVLQIGISLGGAIGPLSLGYVVEAFSYSTAWWVSVVAALLASSVILLAWSFGRTGLRAGPEAATSL